MRKIISKPNKIQLEKKSDRKQKTNLEPQLITKEKFLPESMKACDK